MGEFYGKMQISFPDSLTVFGNFEKQGKRNRLRDPFPYKRGKKQRQNWEAR